MSRVLFLVALLVAIVPGVRLQAQESILPLPLEREGVMAALNKANREHRVLLVVHEWKRPPALHRPWWMNDTLRAWIKWHAVIVELEPGTSDAGEYLDNYPRTPTSRLWGFDIIINRGRHDPLAVPPEGIENAAGPNDHRASDGIGVGAIFVLFQINMQLEMAMSTAPVWATAHELDCPEPKAPKREYLYNVASKGIPAAADDPTPRENERYVDVMSRLKEADRLLAAGETRKAFAQLTWVWERGAELDPAFAIARIGLVLPRMAPLLVDDPAVGDRMTLIGEAEAALYPWFDDREELAYLCLRFQAGEKDKVIKRAIVENLDLDEQSMMGLIPARLADLKAQITDLTNDPAVSAADWKSLMRTVRLKAPHTAEKDTKELWNRARVELAAAAAVRTYATLLSSENRAERDRADRIAQDVLKEAASARPAVRASVLRALVMAAVSVGKADSRHLEWLDEAARIDPPTKGKEKTGAEDPLRRAVGVGTK